MTRVCITGIKAFLAHFPGLVDNLFYIKRGIPEPECEGCVEHVGLIESGLQLGKRHIITARPLAAGLGDTRWYWVHMNTI